MAKSKGRLLSELAEAPKNEDYADVNSLPDTGNKVGDQAFVEASNRLYIWNGSGWYNIALINTAPTWDSNGQPASSYVLSADSPQTTTSITLAASDPEGLPISYTYVTGGQMDSIGTISQDSSVFTITPKTSVQAPDGGTGSITFRATDGVNILPQVSSFTLNFVYTVTNSRYTTLLATATDASDNNNITDASSNNHTMTVSGDAYAGTFSPYRGGGYSFYGHFRPETVSSTLDTYSLSFWYRLNSVIDNAWVFETQSGSFSMMIETDNSGQFSVGGAFETQNDGSGNNYLDNNWHYFVVSRTPSETNWYMDGAQITTARNGSTITTTLSSLTAQAVRNMTFGGRDASSDLGALPTTNLADINFRDIELKSRTHDGSVPTEPVTSSSDTVFLTAHKPYSGYDYGATPTSALIETLGTNFETRSTSPYDYTEYSATDHGGSVYFDGTDDRLETSAGKIPSGSTNFTVSCWFYSTRSSDDETAAVFGQGAGSGGRVGIFLYGGTNTPIKYSVDSGDTDTGVFALRNVWYFVELQVTSSTAKMFINGVEESSKSLSGYSAPNTDLTIGNLGSSWSNGLDWTGYISDFLVQTGTPSGSSTVPTSSRSSSGAELHIKGTDASIIDKSQGSNLKLVGGPTGSTTQAKFSNTKSIDFGSTSDTYVMEASSGAGYTGEFTIEFWMYNTDITSTWQSLITNSYVTGSYYFRLYKQTGNGQFALYHNSTSARLSSIGNIANNTWTHVAIVRDSSNDITVYQDGSSIGSYNNSDVFGTASNPINIGKGGVGDSTNYPMSGYIQDLRITNGLARYTANFTPPTASLEG